MKYLLLSLAVVMFVGGCGCDSLTTSSEERMTEADMTVIRELYSAVAEDDVSKFSDLLAQNPAMEDYQDAAMASWLNGAAGFGSIDVAKLLFQRGWTATSTPAGRSIHPLWNAKGKHYEMAKFLLDNGADPNKERALIGAINSKDALKWVKLFVDYGADVNWCVRIAAPEPYWATPLSWAHELRKQDVIDYLVSKGAVMPDDPRANKQPND